MRSWELPSFIDSIQQSSQTPQIGREDLVDTESIHFYYLSSAYWIHGSATGRKEGTTRIGWIVGTALFIPYC